MGTDSSAIGVTSSRIVLLDVSECDGLSTTLLCCGGGCGDGCHGPVELNAGWPLSGTQLVGGSSERKFIAKLGAVVILDEALEGPLMGPS
jgi:hypothetical protein